MRRASLRFEILNLRFILRPAAARFSGCVQSHSFRPISLYFAQFQTPSPRGEGPWTSNRWTLLSGGIANGAAGRLPLAGGAATQSSRLEKKIVYSLVALVPWWLKTNRMDG
jgi:hypothetical protein